MFPCSLRLSVHFAVWYLSLHCVKPHKNRLWLSRRKLSSLRHVGTYIDCILQNMAQTTGPTQPHLQTQPYVQNQPKAVDLINLSLEEKKPYNKEHLRPK